MDISIINAIIAGVVGLVTGAIGSLIAPWIQWGIEKKRQKQNRRIELISEWRCSAYGILDSRIREYHIAVEAANVQKETTYV